MKKSTNRLCWWQISGLPSLLLLSLGLAVFATATSLSGLTSLAEGVELPVHNSAERSTVAKIELKSELGPGFQDDEEFEMFGLSSPDDDETGDSFSSNETFTFPPDQGRVTLSGRLVHLEGEPRAINGGDRVLLQIEAVPDDNHYVYSYVRYQRYFATLFVITDSSGLKVGRPVANVKPKINEEVGYGYHPTPVTWSFEVEVPEHVEDEYRIEGLMRIQTCYEGGCLPPQGLRFSLNLTVAKDSTPIAITFESGVSEDEVLKTLESQMAESGESISEEEPAYEILVDTPELIEEMATLYNPNDKIKYLTLRELDSVAIGSTAAMATIERKDMGFALAVFSIFVGGILLNLMPCVFPVLGLKVMGFVEQAGSDIRKVRIHGLVFTLGLLVSMWILAGIILTLKFTFGQNVSWGAEQMGNPYFVGAIIVLLFLLGLNMVGVFEIGTSMTRVGGNLQTKKGYSSSFLTGVLTTLIATPCSGPFLGAAMSYTLAQEAWVSMILFTIFGLGIAAPYLVLSFFPKMIAMLPRPGAWMHTFKVIMAFLLFAAVAFFMRVFGAQTGVEGLSWLLMALVIVAIAAYFYGTWSPAYVQPYKRLVFGWFLPATIFGAGLWMGYDAAGQQNPALGMQVEKDGLLWQKWYPGKVEYILQNQPTVIWTDYTALWCPTCLYNKQQIFTDRRVKEKLKELNVQLIKIDDTKKEPQIALDLARANRSIIPVNIIYPPNYPEEPAILLEELISPADALKALNRMEQIIQTLE